MVGACGVHEEVRYGAGECGRVGAVNKVAVCECDLVQTVDC